MIRHPKLYMRRTDIPLESLFDLKEEEGKLKPAGIYSEGKGKIDKNTRSTTLKALDVEAYPDINNALLNMINIWDGTLNPKDYIVREYNYLIYNEGDHFHKHHDQLKDKNPRIFSTSTIISYSEDFEGGEFGIFSNDGYFETLDLTPGETVFFDSTTHHQVFPVKKGTREVLVAWIYHKTYDEIKQDEELEKLKRELEMQQRRQKQAMM